ncbi:MAG TPA: glycosyltransferase family 4 protein [Vicinamibacterales bacterium]|nr:glycosyltransferase family 4 protein [Vicinamibacterales bacterium]
MFSIHIDTATTWRGGQNQVLLTVLGLRAGGERTLLVAHPDGELRRRAAEGLDFVPLAPSHELDLKAGWRLSRLLNRLQPSIVHAHDPHAVAMAALALSMASLQRPCAFIASRRVDFRLKKNSFSRWKYRQVDAFICASNAIAGILVQDGIDSSRVFTVHEGIDVERVAHARPVSAHAELWLPAHAPVVLNIGALVEHKGQRHLVDAAAIVVREMPDARFVILGEGPLRSALEQQVRHLRLEKHVFLPGFRADVLGWLKGADVFVMPSELEGLGTSILDAMAAGLPVVASRTGGIPEVIEDGTTGLLVPPRSAQDLAASILRLLGDAALRERMGQAGWARVREHFTVERMVEGTRRVYRQVVERVSARAADTVP